MATQIQNLSVPASSLRAGDEIRRCFNGMARWLKVQKTSNTPEHARFVTDRGDLIMNPGARVAIRRVVNR